MAAKGLIPFFMLMGAFVANSKISRKVRDNCSNAYKDLVMPPRDTVVRVLGFLFIAFLIVAITDGPEMLQSTSPIIVEAKRENRERCLAAKAIGDELSAENHLRNSTRSKLESALFHEQAHATIDRELQYLVNRVLINGVGVVYAGIPFFVMLVLAYLSLGGIVNLDMIVSKEGLDRRMPFVRLGSVLCILMGFVTFLGYYFWIEGRQVSTCQEISGHWFTYTLTTFVSAGMMVHVATYDMSGFGVWYLGWIAMYQALVLRVLKSTQHFFHDSVEAVQGIKAALVLVPVVWGVAFLFVGMLEHAQMLAAKGDGMGMPPTQGGGSLPTPPAQPKEE